MLIKRMWLKIPDVHAHMQAKRVAGTGHRPPTMTTKPHLWMFVC
jgi:hypothetical protein